MTKKILSRLMKPRLLSRIRNKIRSFFFFDQWTILVARDLDYQSLSWSGFKSLIPPLDRFWADPFPWKHGGRHYIFYEELPYSTKRGHISCITLDEKMNILANQVVLQRPYHLSYPFIFEHEGQLYMIPETHENKTVELYRCVRFPDQWEMAKVLLSDVAAIDATLIEADGKWWMFTNVVEEGGSSRDTLHLYYATSLFADQWTPHPRNPIVKDIKSARPAGRIFMHEGRLIRPSQDCSQRYGYAINFNHIVTLTITDYAETREHTFEPPLNSGKILSVHTWNESEGIRTIDSEFRRLKF